MYDMKKYFEQKIDLEDLAAFMPRVRQKLFENQYEEGSECTLSELMTKRRIVMRL